ncbi:hypothetical protein HMPREF9372_1187 [Sporosarcina newyorkensis 2681]|uniref:SLH domain-containing protein n=1 Tax=Sporosarcina newyorkensis 2681 TaxID=1027292 RepID=F9DQV7_9BACL|nr:S-layer homology domain-containing protein [Sporosarcina newyorkensis]EGQ26796.1 hypothetical protein HMPREF9372_1187 [Sporosarcina newyorkensis 2681]
MKKIVSIFSLTTLLLLASFILVGTNQASAKEFKDVPKSHPNYEAIQAMQKAGYIGGYPDGTFRPSENISRKHVAQLLEKAVKLPALTSSKVIYKDVPKNHPYYTPIMKLSQAGIVGGSNGKFNPNSTITRIQMAKVLDLAFDLYMGPNQRPFEDVYAITGRILMRAHCIRAGCQKAITENFIRAGLSHGRITRNFYSAPSMPPNHVRIALP